MTQFRERIKKEAERSFYKVYTNEKGRPVYDTSIVSPEKRKTYQHIRTVSCFVMDEDGNVLVERRGKSETEPGELDLVSGHIDNNETPTQAMIREYVEELHNGSEEEQKRARNEAIQNLKKLSELDLTFINPEGKQDKYFIQFYVLQTKLKTETIKLEEVEKIEKIPLEKVFEWIRQGKINLQYDKRFEKIFQEVREYAQGKNKEIQKEIA